MKKNKSYVEPCWFDYFSLITMIVLALTLILFLFGINISFYTTPAFIIYVSIASCEHFKLRKKIEKNVCEKDVVSEVFTEDGWM